MAPPNAAKLLRVAPNGQISIGKKWAGREIRVEEVSDTELRIVAGFFVPEHQATFFSPDAMEKFREFNAWNSKNPPKPTNTAALFDRLEKKARVKEKK
ncbi:hypothetical protein WDW37_11715 [Bdellovibrionota bacterium FG-1]